jgi:hypothetical protein
MKSLLNVFVLSIYLIGMVLLVSTAQLIQIITKTSIPVYLALQILFGFNLLKDV